MRQAFAVTRSDKNILMWGPSNQKWRRVAKECGGLAVIQRWVLSSYTAMHLKRERMDCIPPFGHGSRCHCTAEICDIWAKTTPMGGSVILQRRTEHIATIRHIDVAQTQSLGSTFHPPIDDRMPYLVFKQMRCRVAVTMFSYVTLCQLCPCLVGERW